MLPSHPAYAAPDTIRGAARSARLTNLIGRRRHSGRAYGARRRYAAPVTDTVAALDRGREAFARAAWREAFLALSEADSAAALSARDLETLGRSAYMVGDTDAYVTAFERAHRAHLEARHPALGPGRVLDRPQPAVPRSGRGGWRLVRSCAAAVRRSR
jgi:hypothetical protein